MCKNWYKRRKAIGEGFVRLLAILVVAVLLAVPVAHAGIDHGTRAEAVAMVKGVQVMFHKDGAKATFTAVDDKSNTAFHHLDLYVFIYNLNGVCVAHGAIPALIGKNLMDMKDQDGRYFFKEMVAIAKGPGSGWVNYKWPDPLTKKIQDKSAYIEKLGGNYFVGVGVYIYK